MRTGYLCRSGSLTEDYASAKVVVTTGVHAGLPKLGIPPTNAREASSHGVVPAYSPLVRLGAAAEVMGPGHRPRRATSTTAARSGGMALT